MKCFYHTDLDGECSAAIVLFYMDGEGEYVPIDYKDDFPFETIDEGEEVWIVDFSLQKPGDWGTLAQITTDVTWIDHHKAAIADIADTTLDQMAGIRSVEAAGCELTWRHVVERFATQKNLDFSRDGQPRAVELIGDYDTWTFRYGEETERFVAYLRALCDTRPVEGYDALWAHLIPWTNQLWTKDWVRMLDIGGCLIAAGIRKDAETVKQWGFEVEFEGLRGIAINRRGNSSMFDSVADRYDILLPFVYDGRQFTVSLYRGGRQPELDCSEIAVRHGGGGHSGAAGFQCKELPFP